MTPAARFAELFAGRDDVRGSLPEGAVRAPVTPGAWERHLLGQDSLGIYPLRPDGLVHWACLDFDRLRQGVSVEQAWRAAFADMMAVRDVLGDAGFNWGVWPEKSRRKGGHLWLLLTDWAEGALLRRIAFKAVELAGLKPLDVEVFPKQDRLAGETTVGNYVHLPYFGKADPGTRTMVDWETERVIRLEEFLANVRPMPVDALDPIWDQLQEVAPRKRIGVFAAATNDQEPVPCTAKMEHRGLFEGEGRNNVGLLLAKRFRREGMDEDGALRRLATWNGLNTPPMGERELIQVHRQGQKYTSLGCETAAARPYCDTDCPLYPKVFGERDEEAEEAELEAETRGQDAVIGPLVILAGDDKRYRVQVDGKPVVIDADKMHSWTSFRQAAMLQLDYYPRVAAFERKGGAKRWIGALNDLLTAADTEHPEEDLTQAGVLSGLLIEYFSDPARSAVKPADINLGRYLVQDGQILFRPEHIEHFLQNRAPRYTWARELLNAHLKEHAGLTRLLKSLDGRKVKLWVIQADAFAEQDEGNHAATPSYSGGYSSNGTTTPTDGAG